MKFLIRSVYDALPSPANLATWGLCEDRVCKLSGQNGSLAHILSGCKTTLTQGRYRRRHDKVLEIIADVLEKEKKTRPRKCPNHGISFVKEGETKENHHFKIKVSTKRITMGNESRPEKKAGISRDCPDQILCCGHHTRRRSL